MKRRGQSAAFMARIRKLRGHSHSTKLKGENEKMARRKRSRSGRRFFSRSRSHGGSKTLSAGKILVGAGAYGAVREKISTMLLPITSKIPLGSISDEIALFGAGYLIAKKTGGIAQDIGRAAMFVEAARIGEAIANGTALSNSSSGVGSQQMLVTTLG